MTDPTAKIKIRDGEFSDIRGMAQVRTITWRATYGGIVPAEILANLSVDETQQRWEASWDDLTLRKFWLVAETEQGEVVGFAGGGAERTQDGEYDGEIYALYILPAYQKQGIGRRLVRAGVRRLLDRGFQHLLIWVLEDNPARAFYEALGGEAVRRQAIGFREVTLQEVGYGWKDMSRLLERQSSGERGGPAV
jgi:ribosomal protein S18 acetylase RimI-like enzyme